MTDQIAFVHEKGWTGQKVLGFDMARWQQLAWAPKPITAPCRFCGKKAVECYADQPDLPICGEERCKWRAYCKTKETSSNKRETT